MADPSKIGKLLKQVAMGVTPTTARTPTTTPGGSAWRTSTSSGSTSRRARSSIPGIVLQADGGQTGQFRILCDGQHDQGEVEEEEEVVDAVAEQELAEPLQAPGPAPRVTATLLSDPPA